MLRPGRRQPYRGLAVAEGEPHLIRSEMGGSPAEPVLGTSARPLICLLHLTDVHVTDVQSPARFEFFNREFPDPRFAVLLPVQRPQEALTPHALLAMVRTVNQGLIGPITRAPVQLLVTGGDGVDNAQWNEVEAFVRLLDGGRVPLDSGLPGYEGVQSPQWPDDIFWKPDGADDGTDVFRDGCGFPTLPGLMERALQPVESPGLDVPWLGCHGNHEALCQGVGLVTAELSLGMTGSRKPLRLDDKVDRDTAMETFVSRPHAFLDRGRRVSPDPGRRPYSIGEFAGAHMVSGARPWGHGFTEANRRNQTAYHVHDTPAVRLITLDTACVAGSAEGCVSEEQMLWLERRLVEVHSSFRDATGRSVKSGAEDRVVVVISHHGSATLNNRRPHVDGSGHAGGDQLLQLLHRFDNVVLWLNGHTHTNAIRARPDPSGRGGGIWEVTTCALVDWPCQARLVEVFDAGEGLLGIATTMVDHDGPADPGPAKSEAEMAGLHRQLAGNVPWGGFDSRLPGMPLDRNALLWRQVSFPLRQLDDRNRGRS